MTDVKESSILPNKFLKLVSDYIFTFVVGKERKVFNVHCSLFDSISEPLTYMMKNDKMKESLDKRATIDDVEPIIFSLLVQFAYLKWSSGSSVIGNSTSGTPKKRLDNSWADALQYLSPQRATAYRCHWCKINNHMSQGQFPFCNDICRAHHLRNCNPVPNVGACVVCGTTWLLDSSGRLFCNKHLDKQTTDKYPMPKFTVFGSTTSTARPTWKEPMEPMPRPENRNVLAEYTTLQCAKLYVLANRYLVTELADICLRQVRQNLVSFEINATSISEVMELVGYTYENTSQEGDVLNGTADKLRSLVLSYVVDNARHLMVYDVFATFMAEGGGHTADLLRTMYPQQTPGT